MVSPGPIETARLLLEPLTVDAAVELVGVLGDPELHRYTGGTPADLETLRGRYVRQTRGWSDDRGEQWLNWVIRLREEGVAVGYVQASVAVSERRANLAWVVGTAYQGRGFASEAAAGIVERLEASGVPERRAHIHPQNAASEGVARRLGLAPTAVMVDGERVWSSLPPQSRQH